MISWAQLVNWCKKMNCWIPRLILLLALFYYTFIFKEKHKSIVWYCTCCFDSDFLSMFIDMNHNKILIGITYDLRSDYLAEGYSDEETAEFDKESTIDGIEHALRTMGFVTQRIGHVKQLIQRIAKGERWDLVYNICEGMHGIAREAQVPAILDAYQIPYVFSDPMVLALTLDKGMTKRVVRDMGIRTPDFYVVHTLDDLEYGTLSFPVFAKPIAEGTSKGIDQLSVVKNRQDLIAVCKQLLQKFRQPVIIESYLSGREFTVGIVGTGNKASCLGVMEVTLINTAEKESYTYLNKQEWDWEGRIHYSIPEQGIVDACTKMALEAWKGLGCRDGGRVDIRYDASGLPNFLEVNPLPGLNPLSSDLSLLCGLHHISYETLMDRIMQSALERLPLLPDTNQSLRLKTTPYETEDHTLFKIQA